MTQKQGSDEKSGEIQEEKIIPRPIEDEMKTSYIDYSMSVIVGRALPDVRDGLKPVHRRILYAMHDMGIAHNKPYKKSARIVGEVLGKYHPHGDTAVYDSMVRMVQDFSLRYPLVDGQGNFGSIDGDRQAAMRYTEARLAKVSQEILTDIDKETVDFAPNFDNSLQEPTVLPARIPNLIVNGTTGIAVGMATIIPPHNLNEATDAVIKLIDNPEITIPEIMEDLSGPDFPTSAMIMGTKGIKQAYETGRGKITIKARTDVEDYKKKQRIIVSEIPYMDNKANLIEQIAEQTKSDAIQGISDIRDESDRDGMRIVIELRGDANPEIVLNQLYKHTRMQTTMGIIMLALVNNVPKLLNIKQLMYHFVEHRKDVVRRRTGYELRKAEERSHILEGIIKALEDVDRTVKMIKESKSVHDAKASLIEQLAVTEKQAVAVLEMRLQRLTSLEQDKIREEQKGLLVLIGELKAILADEQKILDIIKKELLESKEKYGDERRTQIIEAEEEDIEMEDLIKEEKMVVTVSHAGYIKRVPIDTYRVQARGGKGVIAAGTREEDFVENIFSASTHSYLLVFTNKGNVNWLKVYNVPEGTRQSKGKPVVNLIQMDKDEKITAYIPVKKFDDKRFLMLATEQGIVKKTTLSEFGRPRKGGIRAITLDEGDTLVGARLTNGAREIVLATQNGMAIRFDEKGVRPIGRTGKGVKGINLKDGDKVVSMEIAKDSRNLLTVTENGYGKQTTLSEYRVIGRAGTGVINIQCTERNGKVVSVKSVEEEDEIIIMTQKGIVIRTDVKGVSKIGRNTQGVRLMKLVSDDNVVSMAKLMKESEKELDKAIEEENEDSSNNP